MRLLGQCGLTSASAAETIGRGSGSSQGRDTRLCRLQARVRRPHSGRSEHLVERRAVEPTHAAVAHTEPQRTPTVPIDAPHHGTGQPILKSEVHQRLAIEAPRTVVACTKPDVAGSVFRNREHPAQGPGRPLFPDAESVLFGEVRNGLTIIEQDSEPVVAYPEIPPAVFERCCGHETVPFRTRFPRSRR